MQITSVNLTKKDIAKYPFLKKAKKYIALPHLTIEDLTSPDFKLILERAEERVQEAILFARISRKLKREDIEILSYPAAVVLASATGSSFIKKRYALAEAKQTYEDLKEEPSPKILKFAQNFDWNFTFNENEAIPFEFMLRFDEYLKNTKHLRGKKWKLINRLLSGGNVFLTKKETARLLSEEVKRHIEKRLAMEETPELPSDINAIAEKLAKLTAERIGKAEIEGFPQKVSQKAFPPCIQRLYDKVSSGHHLSHIGRFTLTSFLITVGMSAEKVIGLFKNFSDYDERMTRYQVEHIAGERGSRTQYIPPKCGTLKTHSVCPNPGGLCQRIRHPLSYYRRKLQ